MTILPLVITDSQHINNIVKIFSDIAEENNLIATIIKDYSTIKVSICDKVDYHTIPDNRSRFETSSVIDTSDILFSERINTYHDPVNNFDNDLFLSQENYDKGMKNYKDHVVKVINERITQ